MSSFKFRIPQDYYYSLRKKVLKSFQFLRVSSILTSAYFCVCLFIESYSRREAGRELVHFSDLRLPTIPSSLKCSMMWLLLFMAKYLHERPETKENALCGKSFYEIIISFFRSFGENCRKRSERFDGREWFWLQIKLFLSFRYENKTTRPLELLIF